MGRHDRNKPRKHKRNGAGPRAVAPMQEEHKERRVVDQLAAARFTEELKDKLDPYQVAYYKEARMSVRGTKVVIIDAQAGTGKTTIAFAAGIEALRTGKAKRLTYIRFPSKRGQRLGAIPGDLKEKEALYMQPAFEALAACGLQPEAVALMESQGLIRLCTDTTLRGTNINEEFVIIDEAQNAEDLEQLKLVLTRIHDTSKTVLIGDSGQKDGKVQLYYGLNAFQVYSIHLLKRSWARRFRLVNNYRGALAQYADEIGDTLKELEREAMNQ